MPAMFAASGSRHSVVFATALSLHVAAFLLIARGLAPKHGVLEPPTPIFNLFERPEPVPRIAPNRTAVGAYAPPVQPPPDVVIPKFEEMGQPPTENRQSAPVMETLRAVAPVVYRPASLQTPDARLAALIDSCYPSSVRRQEQEGRAVARVTIAANGRATLWTIALSSGFPRLDAAMDCVMRRLEFLPARRDGSAVPSIVMLPIVFRMN